MSEKPISAKQEIHQLARKHGIVYKRSAIDDWADSITRLSGDDVTLDETECLLVVLGRANILTDRETTILHARYLKER